MRKLDEILARAGIFQGVEPSAVSALTKQLQPVDFPRGHTVFAEGEPGDRLYIAGFEGKNGQSAGCWYEIDRRVDYRPVATDGPARAAALIADLLADPHLEARNYWTKVGGRKHPGRSGRPRPRDVAPLRTLNCTPAESCNV